MANIGGTNDSDTLAGTEDADLIEGFAGEDTLRGLGGGDTLDGGSNRDQMLGGAGDDLYIVDNPADWIIERDDEGMDEVRAAASYTLSRAVENLTLTGAAPIQGRGNSLANVIAGNAGANVLSGGRGDDTLLGAGGDDSLFGGEGMDTLAGGTGHDIYTVEETGDVVFEAAGEGRDTVRAFATFTLAVNLEDLILLGSAAIDGTGNDQNNRITGNAGSNNLSGGAGHDSIDGGDSTDTLSGGDGNDSMSGGAEADTLTGELGDDSLGGGEGADALSGGAGNDVIVGGAGVDSLAGGTGNDGYHVDETADSIEELAGEGSDQVSASATYALSANVERLRLIGSGDIDGTGNDLRNIIIANGGANLLSGLDGDDELDGRSGDDTLDGGAGRDFLIGRAGDDLYFVEHIGDRVSEDPNAGRDEVRASIGHALGFNFEDLTLLGSNNINGSGNAAANQLAGNDGANRLEGFGGNDVIIGGGGRDTLDGGVGDDTFVYTSVLDSSPSAQDRIENFRRGPQVIDLSAIDADTTTPGDQAFTFIGGAAFTGAPGELRIEDGGSLVSVFANIDANLDAEFGLLVDIFFGTTFSADDFVL